MLGVTRKLSEKGGVRYVTLGQEAYVEQMWDGCQTSRGHSQAGTGHDLTARTLTQYTM